MSYRLILLGLLAEQPRYGYEIKQIIEARSFAEYVRLSGGGLYYNLHKLVDEGFIEGETIEREGNYPDRHIYRITDAGRERLIELLRETFSDLEGRRFYDPLDAALVFAFTLPLEEVTARLQHQLDEVRTVHGGLTMLYEMTDKVKMIDPYARLILDHILNRLRAEMAWFEKTIRRIIEEPQFNNEHEKHRRSTQAKEVGSTFASLGENIETREEAPTLQHHEKTGWEEAMRRIDGAERVYLHHLAAAWRNYESKIVASETTPDEIKRARHVYEQQVAELVERYEATMMKEKENFARVQDEKE